MVGPGQKPGSGYRIKGNTMRIAAGLIFAGAISLCASGAAWSQTPAPKAAPAAPQAAPAPAPAAARAPAKVRLRQSRCARHRPRRRDRHHRRTRLRLRALQAARFPARQGSGADVRRRPVAGQYALGAEDAGGRMHHRHFLFDRQARDLLSGNPEAGGCRRPHRRHAHLVARHADQQEADRGAAQGRNRKGFQRGEMGAGRPRPRRSSASRRCSIRRRW